MAGNPRRSIQELSAEVATNPDSTAFVDLVAEYRRLGDLDHALRLCLRGLSRHPTHVEAHFELGCVYRARGERELALDEWSIVRSLAPDHLGARRETAELYLAEGNVEEARDELERALEIAPAEPVLLELSRRLPLLEPVANGARGDGTAAARGAEPEPGALGVLRLDASGEIAAAEGSLAAAGPGPSAADLQAVRAEAERVAEYLELGEWRGMTVEGDGVRWTFRPMGGGVLAVCTDPALPPGRAARAVDRVAERMVDGGGGEDE